MRQLTLIQLIKNRKAQATTELAIMGSIILMALLFLAQQGFRYNLEQGLDMYTFRQALRMSKQKIGDGHRAIDLTVIRELPTPSLFSGISRQRAMASASVAANPYDLWSAGEDEPQDIPTYQLVQINEGMIDNDYFLKVPVTRIKVTEEGEDSEWSWTTSGIKELDSQVTGNQKTSEYTYTKRSSEDANQSMQSKDLTSQDTTELVMVLEDADRVRESYLENDWEDKITAVDVDAATIPKHIKIILDETLEKEKAVITPH